MKNNNPTTMSNMTDEQIAQEYMEMAGFTITPKDEPVEETIEIVEDVPTPKESKEPKFVFSFDMMGDDGPSEKFVLDALHEAMKEVFFQEVEDPVTGEKVTNSKMMARARFYINGEDENGLPYGNFNGAGQRAITMYQPDHPEAGKGRNYGKVFYRWGDPRVEALLDAIFEECGWDPQELLVEEEGE